MSSPLKSDPNGIRIRSVILFSSAAQYIATVLPFSIFLISNALEPVTVCIQPFGNIWTNNFGV